MGSAKVARVSGSAPAAPSAAAAAARHARLVRAVQQRVFRHDPHFRGWSQGAATDGDLTDFIFAGPQDEADPDRIFARLRWGGQFVFLAEDAGTVGELAARFTQRRGFAIEIGPAEGRTPIWGVCVPGLGRRYRYFVARKLQLVQAGQVSDRFTYQVQLTPDEGAQDGYVVTKQVPSYDQVMWRLRQRFPDEPMDLIARRARKLVDKIFPLFLTREAAFLHILQRDLPEEYRNRVPRVIQAEKDIRGFIRCIHLNWLRHSRQPLTQLTFARQAAELLDVLHEHVGIIHLDLRLDNLVITDQGVGFVDFGSAVRVGEDLSQNPMLEALFDEMMSTSQIQRMLGKMTRKGKVTSRVLCGALHKVDKAVDLFYLARQMSEPHSNPDLKDLVLYDPQSIEARQLAELTRQVLAPEDPQDPPYRSAKDVVRGIDRIAAGGKLWQAPPAALAPSTSAWWRREKTAAS